ncbi:hypothetical protein [Ancylomarina sp. 16SWW S1-10-2]|uniref:hypothetical protein n=1 Tax=Ancylomarina sp. 16SWW S1-10-2 TaxID=2499681 RepID=UPI0012ADCF1E|nr:hypothetical protein [Ancylomarina sp. 16SWW S1-10-2]MRT93032.1 hypothetical protein [Ancylomarina sp. 16SWW S1-10-2]
MKRILIMIIAFAPLFSSAQNKEEVKKEGVKVKLSGFVTAEAIYDSRKSVSAREGDVLLYPAAKSYDKNGNDLNDRSEFYMTTIHSRLNVGVSGFEAFGAKGTATIQGDFASTSNSTTGLFRLRHAFVKLDWGKDELLLGKFWHPMFITTCNPGILAWNGAIPFNVLGRAPQIRYTRDLGDKGSVMFAVLSEMDAKSTGPNGASVEYIQQSGVPEFSAQVKYDVAKGLTLGATGVVKTLKPMLTDFAGVETDELLTSYQMNAWMTLKTDKFVWDVAGIYGQNLYNFVMLGGYGVKATDNGNLEYTNISTSSFWSDIYTTTGKVRYGLFAGYTKNLGADDDLATETDGSFTGLYSRGGDIDYAYQFGPRVELHSGKVLVGAQVLYTAAAYGTTKVDGTVADSKEFSSTRSSLYLRYSF